MLLDENELAGDSPYFALGGFAITPSHDLLAYAVDFTGGERYTLRFRDLRTGEGPRRRDRGRVLRLGVGR